MLRESLNPFNLITVLEEERGGFVHPVVRSRRRVRGDSGGCVAERARVPGRFVIATEAVVCRRWSVLALVPCAPCASCDTWPRARREYALVLHSATAASAPELVTRAPRRRDRGASALA